MSLTAVNFAALLLDRLDGRAELVDAPTGRSIRAAEMRMRVLRAAAFFRAAGLRHGDRIVLGCTISATSALVYLAALYAGLVVVPVNEKDLPASGEALCRKAGAAAVWTERTRCDWAARIGIAHLSGTLDDGSGGWVPPALRYEDDLALLMSTSGSTGDPKLVMISHGNLLANTEAIVRSQRLGAGERALLILPISYVFGASVLHSHLFQGGSIVFESRFMFPDKVLQTVQEYDCTTFAGVPTVYNVLLRRSSIRAMPMPSLRRFLQAGGAMPLERIREVRDAAPGADFFVMYGQTEATARIACLPAESLEERPGSVGLPLDNLEIRIVDEWGWDALPGQAGELWVRGRSVSLGYFDDPEETGRKFRDGWLLTGDMVRRDRDGYLWVVGRKSDFIKMRGVRLSLSEIERRVGATRGVFECAAAMVPHPEAGEAFILYVVADGPEQEVVADIHRRMPPDWVCDGVILVPELPKNAHGKLQRTRLAEIGRIEADAPPSYGPRHYLGVSLATGPSA